MRLHICDKTALQRAKVNDNGSPLPTNEWTLMLFVTALSRTLKAPSTKVYLAGVRALHVENGFGNPLDDCLRLQRVVRGIKHVQGTGTQPRLPITVAILRRLYSLIDISAYHDALMWAACCIECFGFLRCGEFTTTSTAYDPKVHLSLNDVKVDRQDNPRIMLVTIKSSKTDQFRRGHILRIGCSTLAWVDPV